MNISIKNKLSIDDAKVSFDCAVEILKTGGVLIFPTETFFGIGNKVFDADASAKIFTIKRRANVNPLPLVLGDMQQFDMVCNASNEIKDMLNKFWPGPLSVVLKARLRVPDIVTGGTGKVALRISSHPICTQLALKVGEPITASSANISNNPPVVLAEELDFELVKNGVGGVLDMLPRPSGSKPSTIIEILEDNSVKILRLGAISALELKEANINIVE